MPTQSNRIAYFDNLKGLLILLVLVGHFFQDYPSIRWPIYTFHMPLFVFFSGYFSKSLFAEGRYHAEKPAGLLFLYLGASILSCWVQGHWLPTFLKPQWGLWYLQALFIWYLCTPLAAVLHNRFACMLALFLFVSWVGEATILGASPWMSLLQYSPFFVLGHLTPKAFHDAFHVKRLATRLLNHPIVLGGGGLAILLSATLVWHFDKVSEIFWHYDMPMGFSSPIGFVGWALRLFLIAPLFAAFLLFFMPRRRLPLAFLGERTLQIYVFHAVFWPWEWQSREWLATIVEGKTASLLALLAWLGCFLFPFWHIFLNTLHSLPSSLLPNHTHMNRLPIAGKTLSTHDAT